MNLEYLKSARTKKIGKKIEFYEEINSTHTYAKENIEKLDDGTVILADKQTAGKGTKGRKWYTGSGLNIAMTIVLKPSCELNKISTLTVDIAKIVKYSIKELYNYELEIKQPNDLMLNSKKISGILTESNSIGNKLNYIILSMGFNVNECDFDEETKEIATSLKREYKKEFKREDIILHIIESLDKYYILNI